MLRRLDRIRFRGHRREDFLDLVESPNASDTECGDEGPLRTPRTSPRDSEELRDPVSVRAASPPLGLRPPALGGDCSSPGGRAERGLGQNVSCPAGQGQARLVPPGTCHHVAGGARPQISDELAAPSPRAPPSSGVSWVAGWASWPCRGVCPCPPAAGGPSPAHAETAAPVGQSGCCSWEQQISRGTRARHCGPCGSQAPGALASGSFCFIRGWVGTGSLRPPLWPD